MPDGLLSKQFSGFHFGGKHVSVTCKSDDKILESQKFPVTMPYKINSTTTGSSSKKSENKKQPRKDLVLVPSARYKKRRGTDEEISQISTAGAIKQLISSRSFSQPASRRRSEEEQFPRRNLTPQFSLFQSPFDSAIMDDQESFRYDVNISYHKNQQIWVEELLLPILEKELGLKCYIFERDSLPGVSTVKNIAAAVKESRITILCFSKDYLTSSWQKYEAFLAHHMDPVGWKKRILPIMVENCQLPLKYTVYSSLKWSECHNAETVPASVRLRRRFFISGLLNALGMHNKEREVALYKTYCETRIPVASKPEGT